MSRRRYVVQIVSDDAPLQNGGVGARAAGVPPASAPITQPQPDPSKVIQEVPQQPKPQITSQILRPRQEPQSEVQDAFSVQEERMKRLFQESSLQEAREVPSIQRPRSPKRVQEQPTSPEEVLRQNIQKEERSQKIEDFYQAKVKPHKVSPREGLTPPKKRTPLPPLWRKIALTLVVILLIGGGVAFSGVMYVRAEVAKSEESVKLLVKDVQTGKWQSARERLDILQQKRATAWNGYRFTRPIIRPFLGKEKTTSVDQLFEVSQAGLNVVHLGLDAQQTFEKGFRQFMGEEEGSSLETLVHVTGQSESLFTELSQLQAKMDRLENPLQLEAVDVLKTELNENVPRMRRYFASMQKLGGALPELLGEEGKKQYLVLLQNNMELRPTGGFIGSFGILTVQHGQFLDFRVEDVYEADGQLNGFVTPPPEIVQYLGEARWFLRDVNWNPDFPTTAQQALWFLDKTINVKADGVIAVNLDVAKKLLEVTGPIELIDYKEVITKDNLYERAQTHSEMNFFPGSTQKRDFLSALANQLFLKLMNGDAPKLGLGQAFLSAADESQVLIALNSPVASQVFANLGWDGSVRTPSCPPPFHTQRCFVDTVMQVEANVGVNKANQYVKRQISHEVEVTGREAKHVREMAIQNTAKSNAWPEGVYRSYLRLYVPKEARLQSVSLDGAVVDLQSVKNVEEGGKRVFGLYLEVPIQKTSRLAVSYSVDLPEGSPLVYSLFEQKQSGVSGDQVTHQLKSTDRQILTVAPEPKMLDSHEATFSSERLTHDFMAVELQ